MDNHCTDKIRHDSRRDADVALSNTRHLVDAERMEPYPCKFCGGWHNGHPRFSILLEHEVTCGCSHAAMTHESGPGGMGCFECECLWPREAVYRRAIGNMKAHTDMVRVKARRITRVCQKAISLIPSALLQYMKNDLKKTAHSVKAKEAGS